MRWHPDFAPGQIKGVDVFLERSQTRQHVGVLDRDHQKFRFVYEDAYLKAKSIMPLGPEFPLTQKEFINDTLFPSLGDRLPDRDNPAYIDYCTAAGIAVSVDDPIILLATIGKRGPSSFIFEPIYNEFFSFKECEKWRKELGLSMQDFAHLFDVSLSILQKMKAGASSGREVLQRLELYWRIPEALDYQLGMKGKQLEYQKYKKVREWLENKMKADFWNPLSCEEVAYTQECLKRLKTRSVEDGKSLYSFITEINKGGITNLLSRTFMFEARFADALLRAGLDFECEHKTQVGDTDVDFCVNHNGKKWLIELTSAQESDAVRSATQPNDLGGYSYGSNYKGFGSLPYRMTETLNEWNKMCPQSCGDFLRFMGINDYSALEKKEKEVGKALKNMNIKSSQDVEVLLERYMKENDIEGFDPLYFYKKVPGPNVEDSQRVKIRNTIFGKVANAKKEPIKFPEPKGGDYHVIIVDTRGLGRGYKEGDWKDVCYGHPQIEDVINNQWHTTGNKYHLEDSERTRGVFSRENTDPRSQYVRKRIHAIGFICEREYVEGEIETILQLYANTSLITQEELDNLWPLRKHKSYDPRNNPNRYSPPLHPDQK